MSNRSRGTIAAVTATVLWGAMFPLMSAVLPWLDPFQLSAERYLFAALILLAILVWREGAGALVPGRAVLPLIPLAVIGFVGFNVLGPLGVRSAGPQHAALIMATFPLLTVLVQWARTRVVPARMRFVTIAAAFTGVLVVIRGSSSGASAPAGDLAVFIGALCWVWYTVNAGRFAWSSLRLAAYSTAIGGAGLFATWAIASIAGVSAIPPAAALIATAGPITFLVLGGAVVAVVAWMTGLRLLGAARTALFFNLVPITAFAIGALRGERFSIAEIGGAALTIAALVADNVLTRSAERRAALTAALHPVGSRDAA